MKTGSNLVVREALSRLRVLGMADFVFANKTEEQVARLESIVANEERCKKEETQARTEEEREAATQKLINMAPALDNTCVK
ncbi:MAG: hypothetical protein IJ654_00200 [Bacteroidales bacterium]|nr:hypothetical protein [Bacteroidales bacterium]